MRFIVNNIFSKEHAEILEDINYAAERLYIKLKGIDIGELEISDWVRKYIKDHIEELLSILQIYSYILFLSLRGKNNFNKNIVLVDYGGGSGILALFAKELKIRTVIYVDIYDVACKDAARIGKELNLSADYYVKGDISSLREFLLKNNIECDSIVSHDVIEHIYDVEDFYKNIICIPGKCINVIMATGANPYNPIINRRLMKKQIQVEYEGRYNENNMYEMDTRKSYLNARMDIIREYDKDLNEDVVEKIAKLTRGKTINGIINDIQLYKKGNLPERPLHPTNTCEPYTGNWEEHLIEYIDLKKKIMKYGYNKVDILPGFYGSYKKNNIKWIAQRFVNIVIKMAKSKAIFMAPFLVVYSEI